MQPVVVPPRLRVFTQDEWFLYFDPHNFTWARLNETGRFLLERFRQHRTVEQVAAEVSEKFSLAVEEAESKIQGFVDGLVEEGFLHLGAYRERDREGRTKIEFAHDVYLHLTNNCNLKCPYCYNKSDRDYKVMMEKKGLFAPSLTTEEYKALIARVIECGVKHILFTGGEPLMRPDVFELLEFARAESEGKDVTFEMLTNAILIKEDVAEKLCDYMDGVTISLDGHERHMHESTRGKNTFAPTIRGIKTLIEVRNRRQQTRPYVATVPALTAANIGFMKEIFEYSIDGLGVDGLAPIIFQAGDHQELTLKHIPTLEDWSTEQRRTLDYLRERNERLNVEPPKSRPVVPRSDCGVGRGEFSIDPSGYVYPCQSLHFDEFIAGNVRETDVKEIYDESLVFNRVRSTVVDRLAVCTHCDLKELCNGGCRATAYNVYRKFDAHNEIYCRHLEKLAVGKMWGASDMPLHTNESACV